MNLTQFTLFDFDRVLGYEHFIVRALESAKTFESECAKCGTPCFVIIRDNTTGKKYTIKQLEKKYLEELNK